MSAALSLALPMKLAKRRTAYIVALLFAGFTGNARGRRKYSAGFGDNSGSVCEILRKGVHQMAGSRKTCSAVKADHSVVKTRMSSINKK